MRLRGSLIVDKQDAKKIIIQAIEECIQAKQQLLNHVEVIEAIANKVIDALKREGTIFLFGNGGSAADAQHIAAELIGRFDLQRKSLPAIALTVNTSNLTAVGNDYGYEYIFSRQLEGLLKKNDLVIAISTSGNSPNVLKGVEAARHKGAFCIGLTGENGGKLKNLVDLCLKAPSSRPSRIQEMHILTGHIVCQIVEQTLYGTLKVPAIS